MLCDECGKRPANVHLTKIINGVKSESHLCEECAREKGELDFFSEPKFSFPNLLAGLLQQQSGVEAPVSFPSRTSDRCRDCGLPFSDFTKTGFLGCRGCYDDFKPRLEPLLRRLHGSSRHTGKAPKRPGGASSIGREIESLRRELTSLVAKERYEDAAKVRDKIRELEKGRLGQA